MGGTVEVPDGTCNKCNAEFGLAEAEIKEHTIILLTLLGIPNRYGVVPKAPMVANIRGLDMENLTGFVDSAGNVKLHDVVRESINESGQTLRQGFFITKEAGDKFAEREQNRNRGGRLIEREVPQRIVIDGTMTQTTPFAFFLTTRKVIAKIALAAIAYQYGKAFALSPYFDVLRDSRNAANANDVPVRIFANERLMEYNPRPAYQHSILCYLCAGTHKGFAIVTLFGGLTYIVFVSENYTERESRQFSIFYDAQSRQRINPVVLANEMTLIGHVLSPDTSKFEDRDAVGAQWFPVLAAFCEEKGYTAEKIQVSQETTQRQTK